MSMLLPMRQGMGGWSRRVMPQGSRSPEMVTTLSHPFSVTGVCSACSLAESPLICCAMIANWQRANLDLLWGRETTTVAANGKNLSQLTRLWLDHIGVDPQLPTLGPFPSQDVFGVTAAVAMLAKSLEPGRYKNYTKFETMRKLRSAFSNLFHASAAGSVSMLTLGRDSAKTFLSSCPSHSLWFERFAKGCL
jgi:hypothetical protein